MEWTERLLLASALVVAVGVLIGAGMKVYRIAHRIDATLGVDKDGRTVSERLTRVESMVWPNGGTSLSDKLNRVERDVIETRSEIRVVRDLLAQLVEDRA